LVITTECLVADKPEKNGAPAGGGMPGGGMGMMYIIFYTLYRITKMPRVKTRGIFIFTPTTRVIIHGCAG
jgi:hypothetical protein